MIRGSLYDQDEMERERKVIIEELAAVNDSPAQKVDVLIDEAVWPGEPLGRDIGGTRDSVNGITRDMILRYVEDQYAPNNVVLAVAGDLDHKDVVAAVESAVGDWTSTTPRSWIPSLPGERESVVVLDNRRTEQAHFCLALRGLSSRHPDRYALGLLNVVLGEGMSSRLFLELRERQGLAYDVHSSVSHFLDDGAVVVYAGVEPARINDAVSRAMAELNRMREAVPEDELEKARAMTKGRLLLRTEDTRSMAGWVGAQELLNQEIKTVDDIVAKIDSITVDDVHRVANDIIAMDRLNLAVVGPFRSQARFERLLRG
jgi:predicted Zn-dependent peptidase